MSYKKFLLVFIVQPMNDEDAIKCAKLLSFKRLWSVFPCKIEYTVRIKTKYRFRCIGPLLQTGWSSHWERKPQMVQINVKSGVFAVALYAYVYIREDRCDWGCEHTAGTLAPAGLSIIPLTSIPLRPIHNFNYGVVRERCRVETNYD